jgi:hypothetical protein
MLSGVLTSLLLYGYTYIRHQRIKKQDLSTFYSIKWKRAYLIISSRRTNHSLINILTTTEKTEMQQASFLGGRGV